MLLENINYPSDLRKYDVNDLKLIADELRQYILDSVSKTGGHLSSNLGTVELTVAIHHVFNTPFDKVIWDVGHQTYAHKVLTGRKGKLNSIRKYMGISGFPKYLKVNMMFLALLIRVHQLVQRMEFLLPID